MAKIRLLILSLFLAASTTLSAQFNVGIEPQIPFGDFGDFVSFGIGASAFYEHPIKEKFKILGGIGYNQFFIQESPDGISLSSIPIQGGIKYFVSNKLFLHGLAGIHIFRSSVKILGVRESDSENEFGIGLGAGFQVNDKIDIGARFQFIEDANSLIARVGYRF